MQILASKVLLTKASFPGICVRQNNQSGYQIGDPYNGPISVQFSRKLTPEIFLICPEALKSRAGLNLRAQNFWSLSDTQEEVLHQKLNVQYFLARLPNIYNLEVKVSDQL